MKMRMRTMIVMMIENYGQLGINDLAQSFLKRHCVMGVQTACSSRKNSTTRRAYGANVTQWFTLGWNMPPGTA
jgi:hypothetical protein